MKTLITILWSLLLIAFFSTLFYWVGKALIEWIGWLIWRVKLQMKRCKEKRRKRRNSSKFDGAYLDSLIEKSKGNWKDINPDEWVNDLRGKS